MLKLADTESYFSFLLNSFGDVTSDRDQVVEYNKKGIKKNQKETFKERKEIERKHEIKKNII